VTFVTAARGTCIKFLQLLLARPANEDRRYGRKKLRALAMLFIQGAAQKTISAAKSVMPAFSAKDLQDGAHGS
jgi:hypothetical protein